MGWLNFWKRSSEADYETLLSGLETSIKARESRLLSIKLRERRANALFITYALGFWIVYLALWWFGVWGSKRDGLERVICALPVIGGPVVIFFTRRLMRYYYARQKLREETTLIELKKQQRDKVEELKRKTGYYSTRNLLEKYDELTRKNAEARTAGGARPGAPSTPSTPIKGGPATPGQARPPGATAGTVAFPSGGTPTSTPRRGPAGSAGSNQAPPFPLLPPAPSTPVKRTVFDKLADALLGVAGDEGTPNSKYALICAKCYAHNGLVVKEEFDTIQYQCPRCGHLNPRRKPLTSAASSDHLRPASGSGHSRRRVQSMHISSTPRRGSSEEPPLPTGGTVEPSQPTVSVHDVDDSEEEEAEVQLMVERKTDAEEKLRKRGAADGDRMDIDL